MSIVCDSHFEQNQTLLESSQQELNSPLPVLREKTAPLCTASSPLNSLLFFSPWRKRSSKSAYLNKVCSGQRVKRELSRRKKVGVSLRKLTLPAPQVGCLLKRTFTNLISFALLPAIFPFLHPNLLPPSCFYLLHAFPFSTAAAALLTAINSATGGASGSTSTSNNKPSSSTHTFAPEEEDEDEEEGESNSAAGSRSGSLEGGNMKLGHEANGPSSFFVTSSFWPFHHPTVPYSRIQLKNLIVPVSQLYNRSS